MHMLIIALFKLQLISLQVVSYLLEVQEIHSLLQYQLQVVDKLAMMSAIL